MVSVNYKPGPMLILTEDEAFALLSMCLLSPMKLDPDAEKALRKLAEFCKSEQLYVQARESEPPPQ